MRQGRRHKQKGEIFEINKENSELRVLYVCVYVCVPPAQQGLINRL